VVCNERNYVHINVERTVIMKTYLKEKVNVSGKEFEKQLLIDTCDGE
jgi:hypothetical protein